MTKYWFEFEQTIYDNPPPGTLLGVGITACCEEQALRQIKEKVFKEDLPKLKKIIVDVAIKDLDNNHVVPNLGNIENEGVWFPLGYQ
jgi:hypothetical protein